MRFTHYGGGDGGNGAIGIRGRRDEDDGRGERTRGCLGGGQYNMDADIYESLGLVAAGGNGDGFLTE